jgi:putative methyltransferase (TIGR04325 family)
MVLRLVLKLSRRAHGLGWHNFNGSWPTLGDVPVTRDVRESDPWAETIAAVNWRKNFEPNKVPICDDTGKLILPLLSSAFTGPLTVLDFGGGAGTGLTDILRFARRNLSGLSYVLVETPAMCDAVRGEIESRSGRVLDRIPDSLPQPLIVNASSSLQYLPDYRSVLARLARLTPNFLIMSQTPMTDAPTYACQILNTPHRKMAMWVFNRSDIVAELRALDFELAFAVDHAINLTQKGGPGRVAVASLVFRPAAATVK